MLASDTGSDTGRPQLRPEDIESKEFVAALRGYDKDEVRAFLTEVAAEYRMLAAQGNEAQALAQEQFEELATHIAAVMRSVAEEAAKIRGTAERDAELVRSAAIEQFASDDIRFKRVLNALREQG